jgi:hypothetical protein
MTTLDILDVNGLEVLVQQRIAELEEANQALRTEILEYKQGKQTDRNILILEGINRIFSIVVQDRTEEELGNECLSVALEVTGSLFGFVNLAGDDGLLHDIAISETGWKQCLIFMSRDLLQ